MGNTTRRLLLSGVVSGAASIALSACSGYPVRYGVENDVRAEVRRQDKVQVSPEIMEEIESLYLYLMSKKDIGKPNHGANGIFSKDSRYILPSMVINGGSKDSCDYEVSAGGPGEYGLFIVIHNRGENHSVSMQDPNIDGIVDIAYILNKTGKNQTESIPVPHTELDGIISNGSILKEAGQNKIESIPVQHPEQFNDKYHAAVRYINMLRNTRR